MSIGGNSSSEQWTIRKILAWTVERFGSKGIDAPRLTAERLMAHALGQERIYLYTHHDQPLNKKERALIRSALKRRLKGEPTQYITGEQGFWDILLQVDGRVLIPRPETECLVEAVKRHLQDGVLPQQGRGLDIGTGSGALALALSEMLPQWRFVATDLSEDALEVARTNRDRLGLQDRVELRQGDLFEPLTVGHETFDLVVANLPYIPSADIGGLQSEVRDFEPRSALDGGDDGLRLLERFLTDVGGFLMPGGRLLAEIGFDQGRDVLTLAEQTDLCDCVVLPDLEGRDRFLSARSAR